jgi:hypothetical protein
MKAAFGLRLLFLAVFFATVLSSEDALDASEGEYHENASVKPLPPTFSAAAPSTAA